MPPHAPPAAPPTDAQVQSQIVNFLWAIAELLRDAFKKSENQNVILPFTVLRRLDYALEPAKKKVLELNEKLIAKGLENRHDALCRASGYAFYNTSPLNYDAILDDPAHLKRNLQHYITGFSENVQEIFRRFKFDDVLRDLEQVGRLYAVMEKFNEKSKINLRPRSEDNPGGLTNHQMGTVFEQLIRRFNEAINENPGEHFTPRDVIHLLVALMILLDDLLAVTKGIRRTVADCAAGTGGMVSIAREEIQARNPTAKVSLFGQELNPQTWAVCRSELLLLDPAGRDADNIALGSTLSLDAHPTRRFDYQFANPPYGTEWKIDRDAVMKEAERGFYGRFGAGLPRISDGQLLFLQHMLAHMNTDTPSFIGIVFNGSPLFTGEAGGGESEIRRWILENDWLHAIVGLPEQLFYNTGIQMVEPSSDSRPWPGETLVGASSTVNGRACRRRRAVGGDWPAALANVQAATLRENCRPEIASSSEANEEGNSEQPNHDRNDEGSHDRGISHQTNWGSRRGRGSGMYGQ